MRAIRLTAAMTVTMVCLGWAAPAAAQNCVFPSSVRIPVARAAYEPITLTWFFPLGVASGEVTDAATGAPVQALGPLPPGLSTETIVIPPETVQELIQSGRRRLFIFRGDGDCRALVEYSGGLGGALALRRIQLRFDAGSPLRIVPLDSELKAWADLVYSGSGELVARWEVAGPESSSGAPQFMVLDRVRRHMGGGGRVSIESPELPTDRTGLFIVRLVLEPQVFTDLLEYEEPVLRYYVSEADESRAGPSVVEVFEPRHQAPLRADTLFRWAPLGGVRAYKIELHDYDALDRRHMRFDAGNPAFADVRSPGARKQTYESFGPTLGPRAPPPPDGTPVAGVVVRGDVSEARLSAFAFNELAPGRSYVFVVRAIAEAGIPVGVSPPRLVYVPNE